MFGLLDRPAILVETNHLAGRKALAQLHSQPAATAPAIDEAQTRLQEGHQEREISIDRASSKSPSRGIALAERIMIFC